MIGKQEWKSMRYYIAFLALVLGVFTYGGVTGWRFYNPDEVTERSYPGGHSTGGRMGTGRFYHK
ncbi:MAG: hypothetical protein V4590_03910 [Bacteroidota bacterium]